MLAVSVATPICYAGTDTVVITGQTAPDGNGSISDFMPALGFNNNADIFILGKITDASGANVDDAILLRPGGGNFRQIVRTGDQVPAGDGVFTSISLFDFNESGQIFFTAEVDGTNGWNLNDSINGNIGIPDGIFTDSVSGVQEIVRSGQASPGGSSGTILTFGGGGSENQSLSFTLYSTNTPTSPTFDPKLSSIVTGNNGVFAQVVAAGDALPNGEVLQSVSGVDNNKNNTVLFTATSPRPFANDDLILVSQNGTINEVARSPAGAFAFPWQLNENDQVLFTRHELGTGPGFSLIDRGIFVWSSSNGETTIASPGQAAPDGNGVFSRFTHAQYGIPWVYMNDQGEVAFEAGLSGTSGGTDNSGLFLGSPGASLRQLVRAGQAAPDGNGIFSALGFPVINNSGVVSFFADLTNTQQGITDDGGVFLTDGKEIITVQREGNPLANSTVTNANIVNPANNSFRVGLLNDFGQVLYSVGLADGKDGLFLFTPEIKWRANANGAWDNRDNWTLGLSPGKPHDVSILSNSDNVIITGPSSDVTVNTLTIGSAGANSSTLALGSGIITTNEGLNIAQNGAITGIGSISGNVINNGLLSPGNSPGKIHVLGDYAQGSSGVVAIELAGLASGTEYDVLDISGKADLNGTLELKLLGSYSPVAGDIFDILYADTIFGTFSDLRLPSLKEGLAWNIAYLLDPVNQDRVRLATVASVPIPATLVIFLSGLISIRLFSRQRIT